MIPCSHWITSHFGIIVYFHHLWKQSVNNLLQIGVTCGKKSARRNKVKRSILMVQMFEVGVCKTNVQGLLSKQLNLKSLFNCTQVITRATCSEPVLPHTSPKKALAKDLAETLICQYIWEQFQETMWAKHLRKDLRLNPYFPEGQQVNKGKCLQCYVKISIIRLRRYEPECQGRQLG